MHEYFDGDWRESYDSTAARVTLDDYEGPEDGQDDEPIDPRDEYDHDAGTSGYDQNWSF